MGWLPWSWGSGTDSGSPDGSGVKKTSGGAFETPSRSNRKQCYTARDAFFECLDKNNVLDSINTKDGKAKAKSFCGDLDQDFEKNCAHSWVSGILSWHWWLHRQVWLHKTWQGHSNRNSS